MLSLISTGPLTKLEIQAQGLSAPHPGTIDPQPCPYCGSPVEWAPTAKVLDSTTTPPKLGRYLYARCQQHPKEHSWGFRDTAASRALPILKPSAPAPAPIPLTQTYTPPQEHTAMTVEAPTNPIEAWIDSRVGGRIADLEAKLAEIRPAPVAPAIDMEAIKAMVAEAAARTVVITVPTMPTVRFEGVAHPQLATVLRYVAAGERFFLLVGPAATGKSILAGQVAEALKVDSYAAVAVTATLQREDLLGCRAHNLSTGTVRYSSTPIVDAWEKGGVICLDEVDRGDPNTLCCLNSIEQGCLYVPRAADEGGPVARSSKAIVIATANTYGTGANRTYVGANQLDAAFLDRWRVIEVGYDRDLEIAVCGGDKIAIETVECLRAARARADKAQIRRPLTTRFARRACSDMRLDSKGAREALIAEAKGWTSTEIATVFP